MNIYISWNGLAKPFETIQNLMVIHKVMRIHSEFSCSPLLTLSVVHSYRLIVNRTSAGGLASCGVSLKLLEEKEEAERALSSAESNLSSCKSTVRRRGKFFGGVH